MGKRLQHAGSHRSWLGCGPLPQCKGKHSDGEVGRAHACSQSVLAAVRMVLIRT